MQRLQERASERWAEAELEPRPTAEALLPREVGEVGDTVGGGEEWRAAAPG